MKIGRNFVATGLLAGRQLRFCSTGKPTEHREQTEQDGLQDPKKAAFWEAVYQCSEGGGTKALNELVGILSSNSLATIFKHGKGMDGFLKDMVVDELSMSRRDDGTSVLSVTKAGEQALQRQPSQFVSQLKERLRKDATQHSKLTAASKSDTAALVAQIRSLWDPTDNTSYKPINDVYLRLYPGPDAREKVRYSDFLTFVTSCPQFFWIQKTLMKPRAEGETEAPALPPGFVNAYYRITTAHAGNNFGGWGSSSNVPTAADVFEILKYIPIHWGNLSNLQLPQDVRKRHIRTSSILQWLRRQPKYFEVRNMAGTLEVRRSVLLHPAQHGFASHAAAEQWLDTRIFSGEHNVITTASSASTSGLSTGLSTAAAVVMKFLVRVVPGYYVPGPLIFKRYGKKNVPFTEMHHIMVQHPQQFEVLKVSRTGDYVYRRRTGGSGAVPPLPFQEAFAQIDAPGASPEQTRALLSMLSFSCPLWDRPEYLYVRLPDDVKVALGGYANMLELIRSKPRLFFIGETYYCRNDLSNPLASNVEPVHLDQMVVQAEENSYLTPQEVADVFHYVCPADQAVPVSHFVECSSPAIRCVLPPRVMSLIELFPALFSWRETSPGVFTIRKVDRPSPSPSGDHSGGGGITATNSRTSVMPPSTKHGKDVMPIEEALDEIGVLVPEDGSGVELDLLESWLSMRVKESATHHFGGVARLLASQPKLFSVSAPNRSGDKMVSRAGKAS